MTAPVRIEASAWGDLRFATLARLCGFADAEHALIKVAKVWSWQTEHYTPDAPTYEVDPEIVESALGPGGAGHMVRARLAEGGPSGLRIKGSKGRIEWLWKKRQASARGGEATKRKHEDKRGPSGPVVAKPAPKPTAGPTPGPLTLSPDLPRSEALAPPRAIPPSGWPGTEYDPNSTRDRVALTDATYRRVRDARAELIAELGLDAVRMPDCGTPAEPPGYRDLVERVRAEGAEAPHACDAVVETLVREARDERSVAWLSERAFTERAWSRARNGGASRAPARSARRSETPTEIALRIAREEGAL